jgi:5-methylcytosine-specific restriction enzyme subunit McrC
MPTEDVGDQTLYALLCDEIKFHQLFERFTRNFCRIHFPECHVHPETLKWPDELECELVPGMRTDVTVTVKNQPCNRLVIDTKYYIAALSASFYGTDKFRSDNLYQLYAYLRTQEDESISHRTASGMLLYPTTSYELCEAMFVQGHRIHLVTVDLSKEWGKIEARLLSLVASGLVSST